VAIFDPLPAGANPARGFNTRYSAVAQLL